MYIPRVSKPAAAGWYQREPSHVQHMSCVSVACPARMLSQAGACSWGRMCCLECAQGFVVMRSSERLLSRVLGGMEGEGRVDESGRQDLSEPLHRCPDHSVRQGHGTVSIPKGGRELHSSSHVQGLQTHGRVQGLAQLRCGHSSTIAELAPDAGVLPECPCEGVTFRISLLVGQRHKCASTPRSLLCPARTWSSLFVGVMHGYDHARSIVRSSSPFKQAPLV